MARPDGDWVGVGSQAVDRSLGMGLLREALHGIEARSFKQSISKIERALTDATQYAEAGRRRPVYRPSYTPACGLPCVKTVWRITAVLAYYSF
ncbi:MAG: hypothetical protein LQ340_001762 [Diploschistes diacapsis]|nr:MAG: hypothetical protein LQ340_001762 [Diploschistes diacapsis]